MLFLGLVVILILIARNYLAKRNQEEQQTFQPPPIQTNSHELREMTAYHQIQN